MHLYSSSNVSFSGNRTYVVVCFVDAKKCDPKVTFPTNCYIEVPEKHMKLDALVGLLSVLQANFVIVMTGSSESASEVQSDGVFLCMLGSRPYLSCGCQ